MAKGISIHIGLNKIDIDHYENFEALNSCKKDAEDMAKIAVSTGFEILAILTNRKANVKNVKKAISDSMAKLDDDDILLVTYSGHGTQKRESPPFDELDLNDEAWCLFDRQILDDELKILWLKFEKKVRILVISDSCHSGTLVEGLSSPLEMSKKTKRVSPVKSLSPQSAEDIFIKRKPIYVKARKEAYEEFENIKTARDTQNLMIASVLLISACQDSGVTRDGLDKDDNGAFTKSLKTVWTELTSLGINNYQEFCDAIMKSLKAVPDYQRVPNQTPNCYTVGIYGEELLSQSPFKI